MKKSNRIISVILAFLMIVSIIPMGTISASAAGGIQEKIDKIRAVYNTGSYFTVASSTAACSSYNHDIMNGEWCQGCYLPNIPSRGGLPSGGAVGYEADTCCGFASYAFYCIFGHNQTVNTSYTSTPVLGDLVFTGSHWFIYLSEDSTNYYVYDANGYNGGKNKVIYNNYYPKSSVSSLTVYHATNYNQVNNTVTNVPTTGISLNAKQLTMNVGESKAITATVLPSNASNKNVTWSSSNTDVATVSSTGVIKAVSTGGVIITATTVSGSYNARIEMIVTQNIDNPLISVTYDGHDYELYSEFLTWDQAKAYCEKKGGHLATITSEGENNAILQMIQNSSEQTIDYEGFFIGLSDAGGTQGVYKWVTDETLSYKNWAVGEPSNSKWFAYHEEYQDYCLIRPSGEWDDVNNYQNCRQKVGFICEYDKTQNPVTVSSIAVNAMPTKTTYTVGETFSSSGLSIKVNMSDGTSNIVTSGFTVSTPDMSTAGTKTVTVTYQGKTATFPITVKAVDTNNPSIKIDAGKAVCGQQVNIPVIVEKTDLGTLTIDITYDSSKLNIASISEIPFDMYDTNTKTPGKIRITATGNASVPAGKVAVLTFDVIAMSSCSTDISITVDEAYDANDKTVELTPLNGVLEILKAVPGDVNGDGKVSAIDARMALQYNAGNKELTAEQIAAADVNGDGKVSAIDARWILQAVAGNREL